MLAYLSSAWTRLIFWFILSSSQYCRQKTALISLSLHSTCYMFTHPVHAAPKLLNLQVFVNPHIFHLPLFHEGQRLSTTYQQQTSPSHSSSWVQTQSTWLSLSEPLLLGLTALLFEAFLFSRVLKFLPLQTKICRNCIRTFKSSPCFLYWQLSTSV